MKNFGSVIIIATLAFASPAFCTDATRVAPVLSQKVTQSTQVPQVRPSSINPTVGMLYSDLGGPANTSSKVGLQAGATMDFGRSNLVFETGLLYSQEGARVNPNGSNTFSGDYNLNYLAVPALAKYYAKGQSTDSFYILGGLVPQFLVEKTVATANGSQTVNSNDFGVNTFDLQVEVGLGKRFYVNKKSSLSLQVSYLRGFTNVTSDSAVGSMNTSAFNLSAGVGVSL